MSTDVEKIQVQEQFEELLAANDDVRMHEFLDEQNISDVAELINENEDHDSYIISRMSIHRGLPRLLSF